MVKCPDCHLSLTQHALTYIRKKGYCKGAIQESKTEEEVTVNPAGQPPGLQKQTSIEPANLTNDIVTQYIQEHPGTVSTYLRNERPMKAQRKHMHARSLLNNTF